MTSMRRNDVVSTSFGRHVLTRILINQCQIITFLILKSDIIKNSRIELRGIVLPVPSNQIKVTFIIILPFNLVHLWFFLFHIEIEGKGGWIIGGGGGGGGAKCMLAPPLKLLGEGPAPPPPLAPPLPTPMLYTIGGTLNHFIWKFEAANFNSRRCVKKLKRYAGLFYSVQINVYSGTIDAIFGVIMVAANEDLFRFWES